MDKVEEIDYRVNLRGFLSTVGVKILKSVEYELFVGFLSSFSYPQNPNCFLLGIYIVKNSLVANSYPIVSDVVFVENRRAQSFERFYAGVWIFC